MTRVIVFNKPYLVLSQFTDRDGRRTLADFVDQPDVYAAGRLDHDSEGLLLLTGDGRLQQRITSPRFKMPKTYLAQVDGVPSAEALERLRCGVALNDGPTLPAQAELLADPQLWPRDPPIRYRAHIPTSWLRLTITEGRNRQVRRMTAAIGHPTLRLVRWSIGEWTIAGTPPGEWREAMELG